MNDDAGITGTAGTQRLRFVLAAILAGEPVGAARSTPACARLPPFAAGLQSPKRLVSLARASGAASPVETAAIAGRGRVVENETTAAEPAWLRAANILRPDVSALNPTVTEPTGWAMDTRLVSASAGAAKAREFGTAACSIGASASPALAAAGATAIRATAPQVVQVASNSEPDRNRMCPSMHIIPLRALVPKRFRQLVQLGT